MIVWSATHPGSVSIPLFSQPCSWIQQPIARQHRSHGEMFEHFDNWVSKQKMINVHSRQKDKKSTDRKITADQPGSNLGLVRFPNPLASGSDIHGSWGTWLSWMGIGNHSNSWSTALDQVCLVRFTIFHVRSVWLSTLDPAVNHHWPSGCILTVTGCLDIRVDFIYI